MGEYENNLKKAVPDSEIEIYKISKISNGKEVASELAEQWKSE